MPKPNIDAILLLLDEEVIAKRITLPHAIAKKNYYSRLQKITVNDHPEFYNIIGDYYKYQKGAALPPGQKYAMSDWTAIGEAVDILNTTYAQVGKEEGAFRMAQLGIGGGLLAIIESLYNAIVRVEEERYFNNIVRNHLSSWSEKMDFMRQFLIRFGGPISFGKPLKSPAELTPKYESFIKFLSEKVKNVRNQVIQ